MVLKIIFLYLYIGYFKRKSFTHKFTKVIISKMSTFHLSLDLQRFFEYTLITPLIMMHTLADKFGTETLTVLF